MKPILPVHKKLLKEILRNLILTLFMIVILFPFLWMIFASFKPDQDVFSKEFHLLPTQWHFENYAEAWNAAPFGRFFINSLSTAGITVLSQVITCTLAAYGFAKVDFKFKKILFTVFLAAMMIPEEAAIIPNYLLVQKMNLTNTSLGIAFSTLTSVFGVFLLRQTFMQIPDDLIAAARLDGCGVLQEFIHIAVPTSKSAITTVGLLAFLSSWNAYMWPYMITDANLHRTLQIGLKYMIKPDMGPQWPMIMAASTIILMPVILLFVFLQKYFVSGMVKSGLK